VLFSDDTIGCSNTSSKSLNLQPTTKSSQAKHRLVARELRSRIEAGVWQPGESIPSEQELTKLFGVALMTVRQAIALLAEDGILRRVHGKGTFVKDLPRDAARTKTRHPMVFLIPAELRYSDSYYFPEVMSGFRLVMDQKGYRFALQSDDLANAASGLEPGTAVACLLISRENSSFVERLRDHGLNVLAINHYGGRRSIPCVRGDDASGTERALDYLVTLGHQRIGFVLGHPDNLDAEQRLVGFRRGAKKHGLQDVSEAGSGFSEESGYFAGKQLLSGPERPTALICASDLAAVGAMKAAVDCGLSIPRDVSIVGYGDFSVARYLTPSLTTVRQDRLSLGRTAAESLILLANDDDAPSVVLPTELIVRDTSTIAPTNN